MNRITDARKRAMIADYVAGEKMLHLSAKYRTSPANIRHFAKMAGIPPRRTVYVKPERTQ
jgi:hypothetical protein